MIRRPPRSTRTDTLFPYTTLFRSDLTEAGHQPMVSSCGRYVLVLNGDIYNHLDLRERLEAQAQAPIWRGHSDTETILAGFVAWGVQQTLQAAPGRFDLALWDRQESRLARASAGMGERPLYLGSDVSIFVF